MPRRANQDVPSYEAKRGRDSVQHIASGEERPHDRLRRELRKCVASLDHEEAQNCGSASFTTVRIVRRTCECRSGHVGREQDKR